MTDEPLKITNADFIAAIFGDHRRRPPCCRRRSYVQKRDAASSGYCPSSGFLDAGTHESLLDSAIFIRTLEQRQGLRIAYPEEIAWRRGWIDDTALARLAQQLMASGYGIYLSGLLQDQP